MGQTITLYRVSLDGQMDIIAFLGEQDAQTYSTILFSGYDQYMILESETDIEDIKGEYTYTIDDVKNTLLKPKGIVESSIVFSFMKTLNPKRQNAFLFREK